MAEGPDDISPVSVAAQALMVAKADREALEAELEALPPWQLLRRRKLQESLARVKDREADLLTTLGARPHS